MNLASRISALAAATLMTAACVSHDAPARTGQAYACTDGTQLRVTYLRNGALVSVDGARAIPFARTESISGAVYENGASRLARSGNQVTWNTAQRSAPVTCQITNTIN